MAIFFCRFKVQGSYEFPIDMMRYDSCYPASEGDSGKINSTFYSQKKTEQDFSEKPIIELVAVCYHTGWAPTIERWKSFGWNVVAKDKPLQVR